MEVKILIDYDEWLALRGEKNVTTENADELSESEDVQGSGLVEEGYQNQADITNTLQRRKKKEDKVIPVVPEENNDEAFEKLRLSYVPLAHKFLRDLGKKTQSELDYDRNSFEIIFDGEIIPSSHIKNVLPSIFYNKATTELEKKIKEKLTKHNFHPRYSQDTTWYFLGD